jgi:hypothetical protein
MSGWQNDFKMIRIAERFRRLRPDDLICDLSAKGDGPQFSACRID